MKYMKSSIGTCHEITDLEYFYECNPEIFLRPCSFKEYENYQNFSKSVISNHIHSLSRGRGSLKSYKYTANGMRLHSKPDVMKAIRLNFIVKRYDKIMERWEIFNPNTMVFDVIEGDRR